MARRLPGCTSCGSQDTVTVDAVCGRRCAACPPEFDPNYAVGQARTGLLGTAFAYCRLDLDGATGRTSETDQLSAARTRSAGTVRSYCAPGATEYRTEARQLPSGHRVQPFWKPVYQRLSSWRTSTGLGGSIRRTFGSVTEPTVGAR